MNFAFALAVAGLAFSAASVVVTSPGAADGDVDVVGLKNAAEVGLVRLALAEALEGRLLVAEGFEEREGELLRVERPLGQLRYRLFDLDSVHFLESPTGPIIPATQHR